MRSNLKILFVLILGALFFSGCATSSPFVYDHPQVQPSDEAEYTIAYHIDDQRTSKDIDQIYETKPMEDINKITEEELYSTGMFREVTLVPEDKTNDKDYMDSLKFDYFLKATLSQLKWEVPDYNQIIGTTFVVSFLTGGIGGVIYGSTPTDVYGDTAMHIKLVDLSADQVRIDKDYIGHHEARMAKFSCDTATTKATMIGKSMKSCMETIKGDLIKEVKIAKGGHAQAEE